MSRSRSPRCVEGRECDDPNRLEEQCMLVQCVKDQAGDRVVVVSTGTGLGKSPEEQAKHIKAIAAVSDAVVVRC